MRPRLHPLEIVVLIVFAIVAAAIIFAPSFGCYRPHVPAKIQQQIDDGDYDDYSDASPPAKHHHAVPASLKKFDAKLDWLLWLSVIACGVAATLFFMAPAAHKISLPIAGGAGTILSVSLILKTSLWLVPWIAGAAFICAFALFTFELYRKFAPVSITVSPQTPQA